MALLEIDKLNTGYGEVQALWDVSLDIEGKGITALLGANGAGKTTLLNVITGLQKAWSGEIRFAGKNLFEIKPHNRVDLGIAMVPEGRGIFYDMSVYENLLMGAYTKNAREKTKDSLDWVYSIFPVLKERPEQMAGTLSGGEQQMLAIARALMSRPKLLLLDEVSTGLAPALVLTLMDILVNVAEKGLPMLLVEQHIEMALEVSRIGYVLENGRVVIQGESKDLRTDKKLREAYMGI
ncbi:MAG: ABC transporter ATP-binding protein [Candidatus Bathyarchaeota archaeon]|nr:ABC transporter ATP-binding protein [Candidatus Bathyarchaeota archaeon]